MFIRRTPLLALALATSLSAAQALPAALREIGAQTGPVIGRGYTKRPRISVAQGKRNAIKHRNQQRNRQAHRAEAQPRND